MDTIPNSLIRTCKGCKADVVFVKVPGKAKKDPPVWTIIDPEPSDAGTYLIELDPTSDRPALRGGRIEKRGQRLGMQAAGVKLRTNHYKTCPKAEEFKRARKTLY
ncbi:MAG TPA: hypothetical protein VK899_02040 [Gemmatimonadales bacterium]|nr:hypothetical protein [Gemmatimonadales bacterium]